MTSDRLMITFKTAKDKDSEHVFYPCNLMNNICIFYHFLTLKLCRQLKSYSMKDNDMCIL